MTKVLIVDGYSSIRELLAEDLANEGNMVVAIGRTELVGEMIQTFEPDLVIMDPYLKGIIRWDVLEEIKNARPSLPILIFTAHCLDGDPRLSRAEGCIIKSYFFDKLKQRMREIGCRIAPARMNIPSLARDEAQKIEECPSPPNAS